MAKWTTKVRCYTKEELKKRIADNESRGMILLQQGISRYDGGSVFWAKFEVNRREDDEN